MRPHKLGEDAHQGQGMMAPPSQSQRSHQSNLFHLSGGNPHGGVNLATEERPQVAETSVMDNQLSEDSAFQENPLMLQSETVMYRG